MYARWNSGTIKKGNKMNWKSIWEEFAEWCAENDQSSWEEQQKIIEGIVERFLKES